MHIKKIILVIMLLVLSLSLSACYNSAPDEDSIYGLLSAYCVPGMFNDGELRGKVEDKVLERDDYGRVLYQYNAYNNLTEQNEYAWVIGQKYDDDYVYFYEDICYITEDFSDSNVENLKSLNDWGKPLNESKMSRRKLEYYDTALKIHTPTSLFYGDVINALASNLNVERNSLNAYFCDDNAQNQELYWVSVIIETGETKMYLAILDDKYNVVISELEDMDNTKNDIAEFKKSHGWKYGY